MRILIQVTSLVHLVRRPLVPPVTAEALCCTARLPLLNISF